MSKPRLSSHSSFFHALFTGEGFRESSQDEISVAINHETLLQLSQLMMDPSSLERMQSNYLELYLAAARYMFIPLQTMINNAICRTATHVPEEILELYPSLQKPKCTHARINHPECTNYGTIERV
jgi:hypothetical protein